MPNLAAISVVDDDNSVRESLHCLLRSLGFTVTVFSSAEEFLQSAHFSHTDCLLLDIQMPGMNGIELQRELRARAVGIPIIFVTAQGDDRTRSQAMSGGAVAFLVKPLREEMVLTALDTALNK